MLQINNGELRRNKHFSSQKNDVSWYAIFIKVIGIEDVTEFEFMDPPSEEARDHALKTLKELKALDSEGDIGNPQFYLILWKHIFYYF